MYLVLLIHRRDYITAFLKISSNISHAEKSRSCRSTNLDSARLEKILSVIQPTQFLFYSLASESNRNWEYR